MVQSSSYGGSSSSFGVLVPIAVTVALEDVAAMRQAIKRGFGQAFATQDLDPRLEGQVGGDQAGAFERGFGRSGPVGPLQWHFQVGSFGTFFVFGSVMHLTLFA